MATKKETGRNKRLYKQRKANTLKAGRKLHRVLAIRPGRHTTMEYFASHLGQWIASANPALLGPLKRLPLPLPQAQHGPTGVVCAEQTAQNILHLAGRTRIESEVSTGGTANKALEKENQRPVQLMKDDVGSVTDRDAEYESMDEGGDWVDGKAVLLTNKSRDLAQAGLHGHPMQ